MLASDLEAFEESLLNHTSVNSDSVAPIPPPVMRIINGSQTNLYPSVGTVGDSTFGQYCTGTLIAPQYVLTAAHCAVDGSSRVGDTQGRVRLGTTTYSTSQVIVHPDYNESRFGTDAANDIAIYKLAAPITTITPSNLFRQVPTVGTTMTLVGFGGGGSGNTGSDGSFGTKRVGTTPIDRVTSTLIHWTFDNNTESNTAPGDSGGPSFIDVGGDLQVAGVTSGGTLASAGIGDESYNTRVDAYVSWIDSILNEEPTADFIDYSTAGASYSQSFDTLASSGTSSSLPSGWMIAETGNNANTTYGASSGTDTAGNTYSFGASSSTERALGSLLSGSLTPTFGAVIKNSTGAPLTSMSISYRGEQWRLGTTGRVDRLDFQYSLDATALTNGTWVDVNALDFVTPTTTGPVGALNGNVSVNQSIRSATIENIDIPHDAMVWIRFADVNASGADDSLAIDDFVFSASADTLVTPTITATPLNKVYDGLAFSIAGTADDGPGGLAADTTPASFTYTFYAGPNLTGGVIAAPKNVGSYSGEVSYVGNASYNPVASAVFNFEITPFTLVGDITAANKVFDGTTTATILTRTLSGVIGTDVVDYVGGTATFDSAAVGVSKTVTAVGLSLSGAAAGNYTVNTTATTTANITQLVATVVNRRVFYNNAQGFSSAGAAEAAIASDKSALMPGEHSTYANYTNYSRGLNGVIVDINNLPLTTTDAQILASLQFARWDGISAAGFVNLPAAAVPSATILAGSGVGGSVRIKITFPDNTLHNTWLRITVLANTATALDRQDEFYFGNVLGEVNTANTSTRLRVNANDTGAVRSNLSPTSNSVGVSNIYDVNRDGRVNATDIGIVRSNQRTAGIVAPFTAPAISLPSLDDLRALAVAPNARTSSIGADKSWALSVETRVLASTAKTVEIVTLASVVNIGKKASVIKPDRSEITQKNDAVYFSKFQFLDYFFASL